MGYSPELTSQATGSGVDSLALAQPDIVIRQPRPG